jgi:hypothetical protein
VYKSVHVSQLICIEWSLTNTGVLGSTVVLAITKVTDPRLERGGVVLTHNLAISLNRGMTRNGCPFTRAVDEANVDRLVFLEVVCLAGLGVGVEEEVEAVALLCSIH